MVGRIFNPNVLNTMKSGLTSGLTHLKGGSFNASPPLPTQQRRDLHIFASKQTTESSPTHVQFQLSDEDMDNHPDLAPAFGHSPIKRPDTEKGEFREMVKQPVDRGGKKTDPTFVHSTARDVDKDDVRTSSDPVVHDFGPLTSDQAKYLRSITATKLFPEFATAGVIAPNCTDGARELAKNLLGVTVEKVPFEYPQETAARIHDAFKQKQEV